MFLFTKLFPLVAFARQRAMLRPYDGREDMALMRHCAHLYAINPRVSASLIYTRDVGHHLNGWWKNPDYERCMHLSISFCENPTDKPVPFMRPEAEKIARAFFGADVAKLWVEPPVSDKGIARGVHHYRLFCDAAWTPILPHGEVYSRENTPPGWQSFSELHGWSPSKEQAPWLKSASE